ncbi:unnamed protein product [Soboliphyme baturini]|uniref:Ubiquitin-like domain-containing protein n=1 Tax=Soboliphyme baturini TaxID=241478 RepID=A0A183IMW3_9BILA|nr:unnamed protein product [Soboliphyme baturini]
MQLVISTIDGQILNVNVSEDIELENLLVLCSAEISSLDGSPPDQLVAISNGRRLIDRTKTLRKYGLSDGDIILVQKISSADVFQPDDLYEIRLIFDQLMIRFSASATSDTSLEKDNIDRSLETAIEHTPESFGNVSMLYIRCKVNGHDVRAFIDTGAQTTLMSAKFAQECNVMRLVDKRFEGVAKGVGTCKTLGRIHLAQLQIEDVFLPTSFTVLEDSTVDLLLGLDMLKRHQCIIDLRRNLMVIGTTGRETKFLPESEIPKTLLNIDPEDLKSCASMS